MRTARLFHGDCREVLRGMAEKSAHVSIYSPPYWQLRSYLKADDHLKVLEVGQEATPQEYVAHQAEVASEVRRVLRDDGTLWIVIGDKLVDDRKWGGKTGGRASAGLEDGTVGVQRRRVKTGLEEGNLAGIPYRLALALQADGWFWRSCITWEKLTCMPSSQFGWHWAQHRIKVEPSIRAADGTKHKDAHWKPQGSRNGRDFDSGAKWAPCPGCKVCLPNGGLVLRKGKWRPTTSHETILMFSKSAEYYGDGESVREEDAGADHPRRILSRPEPSGGLAAPNSGIRTAGGRNGAGRNLRSVWTLGPEPLAAAHHAAFPTEIPARIIRCSTPDAGCCAVCGAPCARVVAREFHPQSDVSPERSMRGCGGTKGMDASNRWQGVPRGSTATATTGWRPTCRCSTPGDPVPCTVLDPFMGSGRTGVAALDLGRRFVGIDLSRTYLETIARPAIAAALAQDVIGEERQTIGLEVDGEQRGLFDAPAGA